MGSFEESAEQDQTAHTCSLILLYTILKADPRSGTIGQRLIYPKTCNIGKLAVRKYMYISILDIPVNRTGDSKFLIPNF